MSQTTQHAIDGSVPPHGLAIDDGGENAKTLQIFAGARAAFLRHGFDGASMNDVARAAGVSKGTLYVYFDSKERLFEALVRHDRRRQAEQLCRFDSADHDIRAVLERFGCDLMAAMMQPGNMAHVRMVLGAIARFPQIGRAFYEAGPEFAVSRLARYLEAQAADGLLAIDDCAVAALHFLDLCQSGLFKKVMFGIIDEPDRSQIEANVRRALDVFMAAYGV